MKTRQERWEMRWMAVVAAAAWLAAASASPAPTTPDALPDAKRALLELQSTGSAGSGPTGSAPGSGAAEEEDAPLESQQGILVTDKESQESMPELEPNEPAPDGWPRGAGAGADQGAGPPRQIFPPPPPPPPTPPSRRSPHYRVRKAPFERRRKYKVLRREPPGPRPLSDQPEVYVVDETVTGYAAEGPVASSGFGEPGGGELSELGELQQLGGLGAMTGGMGVMGGMGMGPVGGGMVGPGGGFGPLSGPDAALLSPAGGAAWIDDGDALHVRHRLQKLDFYFSLLRILSEDCRQRVLCEVAREPDRFSPLAAVLGEVTSFSGSYQYVTSHLINTTEGARLLSYMEASFRGQDRARSCAVFQYRCPSRTEDMINYDALCLWREMVRWLTIHVVARPP